jgi:hypothetical protein
MKAMIEYEDLSRERRPRDEGQDARGWKFETIEHDEMALPRAIRTTDAEGRSFNYLVFGRRPRRQPIEIKAVDFDLETRDGRP